MQRKLFSAFVIVLLIGILLTGMLALSLVRSSYINEVEKRLITNAYLVEAFISEKQGELSEESLQRIAVDYGKRIEARITIVDAEGRVLAETLAEKWPLENHRNRPEIQEALAGRIGRSIRYSNTAQLNMLYIAIPLLLNTNERAVLRLAVNLLEIKTINQSLYYYIGISTVVGLIVALTMGYRFIGKIVEPIRQMTEVSKKIAMGHFNRKVYVVSEDELGELATHFNHMADRLKETIEQLSDSNTKFKALLTSIINPIVAVDTKCRVILLNPAAEALFNIRIEDAMGKHILEIIRNNSLDEQLKEIFQDNTQRQIEICTDKPFEKILKIYTNPIRLEHDPTRMIGVVALIEDISEIRKLEKMRSDFVANVSHELKTPLTSISGFIETLKSGTIEEEETKMRFLDIIDIETERLTRLINDILSLSEIENAQNKIPKQKIKPSEAITEVVEMMNPIALGKNIELISKVDTNLAEIMGNRDWFKQMIINLLDNAIKYTGDKGRVQLAAYQKYNNIVITIKDSGIGIPKQELPRLFERFYRVDKARSRKVGGTGLGLAIVKHIVLSLNGKIKVNSDVGKGTEFTIIIPIPIGTV